MASPQPDQTLAPNSPDTETLERRVQGRKRLVFLLSTLMLLTVALAAYGIWRLQEIAQQLTEVAERDVPLAIAVAEIDLFQHKQVIQLERSLRLGEAVQRGEVSTASFDGASRSFSRLAVDIDRSIDEAEAFIGEIRASVPSKEVDQEFQRIAQQLTDVKQLHVNYVERAEGMFALLELGQLADARILAAEIEWEVTELTRDLERIRAEIRGFTEGSLRKLRADERDGVWGLSILGGLTLLLGMITLMVGLRSLVRAERRLHAQPL